MICEKIRGTAVWGRVKRGYLHELAAYWYRIDTIDRPISRRAPRVAQPSVDSPAKSDSTVSRARTSAARAPSTITSAGRGREL